MKKILLISTVVLGLTVAHGQTAENVDYKSRFIKNDLDLVKCAVSITCHGKDKSSQDKGTAYFFYNQLKGKLFLVTNKHVISKYSFADINLNPIKNITPKGKILLYTIDSLQNRLTSFNSNIDSTDIVLINITGSLLRDLLQFNFSILTDENIPTAEIIQTIELDEKVIVIGYPSSNISGYYKYAFVKHCNFSTFPAMDYSEYKEFCIDCLIAKGGSGSAVILKRKSQKGIYKYYLLGTCYAGMTRMEHVIEVGVNNKDSSLYKIGNYKNLGFQENVNISYVIKSEKLWELANTK